MDVREGNYNLHAITRSLAIADPENVARYWAKPLGDDWGQNWQRSDDLKIWELFDKQSRTIDAEERKRVVRELDLRMIEVAARPVVHWRKDTLGMWPEVRNRGDLVGNLSFQKYQDTWLAK
ncbi:MAG: hypothetical protein HYX92_08235 [Chloroflexi bacterium]|nr:hypothetical protein [Chloroflexota bacterium]